MRLPTWKEDRADQSAAELRFSVDDETSVRSVFVLLVHIHQDVDSWRKTLADRREVCVFLVGQGIVVKSLSRPSRTVNK